MLLMFRPCTLTEEHGGNVQKPALLRHHIYKVLLQYYKARAIQVQFCIKTVIKRDKSRETEHGPYHINGLLQLKRVVGCFYISFDAQDVSSKTLLRYKSVSPLL
uniref:Uncharacterized protein n=1 Tax=Magallana gigas TaxID=29159 RepID=K1RF55_MAGGI